jgi:hypothetical protein
VEAVNVTVQNYYDKGYITTTEGYFTPYEDFSKDWAQIGWYNDWSLNQNASDFFIGAHVKWSTATQNPDLSGCGYEFARQGNGEHYAVFLDKGRIVFLHNRGTGGYEVGKTRGSGRVNFGNPAEADFVLIVKGNYAYVLVNDKVVGEYTLSADSPMEGEVALTILSGTNKDYGTRCEMTDILFWVPK